MSTRFFLRIFSFLFCLVLLISQPVLADIFTQDFSSKETCDTNATTAWWDTTSQQLKLHPFSLELVGSYDTPSYAVRLEVWGPFAYIADQWSGLTIVDISEPATPSIVGNYDTDDAYDVAVAGTLAYVLNYGGEIAVIDVSDPSTPSQIGSYDLMTSTFSLERDGHYLYVTCDTALVVIDVSDPTTPALIGSYQTMGTLDLVISGDYAYTTNFDGLKIFDISDRANPDSVQGVNIPPQPEPVLIGPGISGNTLYLTTMTGEFGAIDVTNPLDPIMGGAASMPGYGLFMDITGDFAYAATLAGVAAIDISDRMNPVFLEHYDISEDVSDVEVVGNYVYVAAGDAGLLILKAADEVRPPLLAGNAAFSASYRHITIDGNYAFAAGGSQGMVVFDITDPAMPILENAFNTGGLTKKIAVVGDVAYLADGNTAHGFKILDISDPTVPSLLGSYPTMGGQDNDVAVSGDYAYVADHNDGMYIFDISDPANPDSVGFYPSGNASWAVAADWPLVYLADGGAGLTILDVLDPSSPNLIGNYDTPGNAIDVEIRGVAAFVADGFDGIHVFDVSDPTSPTLVSSYDTPDFASTIAVDVPFVYVADRNNGVHVIDFSDYTIPVLTGSYNVSGQTWGVAAAGDYVFFGTDNDGLYTVQVLERSHAISKNVAQSVTLHTSGQVDRIRLEAFPTDSILWEVSADNGSNWDAVALGAWHDLSSPGVDLLLRATLEYTAFRHYPICDSMLFELEAGIVSVLITSIEAATVGDEIRISWDISADENIKGFNLYRTSSRSSLTELVNSDGLIPVDQRQFIDSFVKPGIKYSYTLAAVKQDGSEVSSRVVTAKLKIQTLALEQNYPNPFNPSTTISYTLPDRTRVRLAVYNLEGRLVKMLVNKTMSSGLKTAVWNGTDANGNPVASGVYFYQLDAGGRMLTRKMMLLK